ncbi:hypothetical protein PR048_032517 [Dryococelus australis]|uniref:Uncharacterized protein n=1 Tax=Dryococelus australis TaxID=614101 RepID=A0ABQ9G6K5_9NEOP|nr:hypothetical protein PR048_032517 [Dryococelus australis]
MYKKLNVVELLPEVNKGPSQPIYERTLNRELYAMDIDFNYRLHEDSCVVHAKLNRCGSRAHGGITPFVSCDSVKFVCNRVHPLNRTRRGSSATTKPRRDPWVMLGRRRAGEVNRAGDRHVRVLTPSVTRPQGRKGADFRRGRLEFGVTATVTKRPRLADHRPSSWTSGKPIFRTSSLAFRQGRLASPQRCGFQGLGWYCPFAVRVLQNQPAHNHVVDKIAFKRVYTELTVAIGSEFVRDTLDDSALIADLQGNKKRIPSCQKCGNPGATANEQTSVRLAVTGQTHAGVFPLKMAGREKRRCDLARDGRYRRGSPPFPPPFNSGATPYSPRSPSSALKITLLRAAQTLFAHSVRWTFFPRKSARQFKYKLGGKLNACNLTVSLDRRMDKVTEPMAMLILHKAEEYTTCIQVHTVRREHSTPVERLALRGDGVLNVRGIVAFISPALHGIKCGKKLQLGGGLKAGSMVVAQTLCVIARGHETAIRVVRGGGGSHEGGTPMLRSPLNYARGRADELHFLDAGRLAAHTQLPWGVSTTGATLNTFYASVIDRDPRNSRFRLPAGYTSHAVSFSLPYSVVMPILVLCFPLIQDGEEFTLTNLERRCEALKFEFSKTPANVVLFPTFGAEKRGRDKDAIATCIKSPVASKRKALNCRAVFTSHCVYLWDLQRRPYYFIGGNSLARRMNKVMRPITMLILHKAEEYIACIEVDLKQGFQTPSVSAGDGDLDQTRPALVWYAIAAVILACTAPVMAFFRLAIPHFIPGLVIGPLLFSVAGSMSYLANHIAVQRRTALHVTLRETTPQEIFRVFINGGEIVVNRRYHHFMAAHIAAGIPAHAQGRVEDCTRTKYGSRYRVISAFGCVRALVRDGNTARLARRSDEALGVRVSVARIAPSLLDLGRAAT